MALYPMADQYAASLALPSAFARESATEYDSGFHWSERHLQCVWFDSRYRPARFAAPGGETVTVLEPGEWNLEAGPDFLNAALLIEPDGRRLRGDVEVHLRPSDWDAHKHERNPLYNNVVAHITWYSGPPARNLPPSTLSLALAEAMPPSSLDDIDVKAYPHAYLPKTPRPCQSLLENRPERVIDLLTAAGQYRLLCKSKRIRTRLQESGNDRHQVFYEEFMAALGYKHNQTPFRILAHLVPASALACPREQALAMLLGAARLLPQPETAPDPAGRNYIRALWDLWWKHPADTLPESVEWRVSSLRPHNLPARRIAAAAALFSGVSNLLDKLQHAPLPPADTWHKAIAQLIEERCEWGFWNQRLGFGSTPDASRRLALLGRRRIAAILANVILPFAAVDNALPPDILRHLPPEDISATIRTVARLLLGRDHNPALYTSNGLLMQGLIQIYQDHCLNAKPGCEECRLYAHLRS